MSGLLAWWDGLDIVGQIYTLIAVPATLILVVQTVLLFIGFGEDDGGDMPDDGMLDGSDGLTLFSIRGIMAMLSVGGWSGLIMNEAGWPIYLTVILSLVFGMLALVGIAYMIKGLMKLQSSGNIDISNAVGTSGRVYIPIPPENSGIGKVNITVQDRYIEVDAVTDSRRKLKTGESIKVISKNADGTLLVAPVSEE